MCVGRSKYLLCGELEEPVCLVVLGIYITLIGSLLVQLECFVALRNSLDMLVAKLHWATALS